MYGTTAGATLLAGLSPRVLSRLSAFYGVFVLSRETEREVESLRRAVNEVDLVAPAGVAVRDAGALDNGLGVAVPVMYIGGRASGDPPPLPTPLETALARFCALVVSVACTGHHRRAGRAPKAPPGVGLLYGDDDLAAPRGLAASNVAYVNVRGEVARARLGGGGAAAVAPLLEVRTARPLRCMSQDPPALGRTPVVSPCATQALAKTTIHEAAHVLVDPSENHSRAFWDAHVDMSGDFAVHGACAALCGMLTGRGAVTLEGALATVTAVLAPDCESAARAATREERKRKRSPSADAASASLAGTD